MRKDLRKRSFRGTRFLMAAVSLTGLFIFLEDTSNLEAGYVRTGHRHYRHSHYRSIRLAAVHGRHDWYLSDRRPVSRGTIAPPAALDIQIRLDQAGFSPGEIDGNLGRNTRLALAAFQQARGLQPAATIDEATRQALSNSGASETLVSHKLTPDDVAGPFLDNIPRDLMKQATLPGLYYTSPIEKLGEKFHISPMLLKRLNPGTKFAAGEEIKVPNVSGTSGSEKEAATPAPPANGGGVTVVVSKKGSSLTVKTADGRVIFHAPVTSGSEHDPLPIGQWKVTGVSKNPTFHYNPTLFWDAKSRGGKADIKPGPNNPVGVVWIDISKEHYGIHGSPEPGNIGHTSSHGCVRLTNWDAMKVASLVKPGTPVFFVE
ncbi:MAG TPA: L,D-transpeptidase [Acidobacteriota bacterium]|nr:L,D-transpeptidase [Acidobacteriota bacterium]